MWDRKRYRKTITVEPHWRQPQFDSFEAKLRAVAHDLPTLLGHIPRGVRASGA
jgi:hypothetical protein